jgi:hypothetical protein
VTACESCGSHVSQPFVYEGHEFCCECMGALVSWFLDGGMVDDPHQFAYVDDGVSSTLGILALASGGAG